MRRPPWTDDGECRALIGRPAQTQQIALSLPAPWSEDQRQLDLGRRDREDSGNVLFGPNLVSAVGRVQAAASLALLCKLLVDEL
jgi:hypothetical protein